MFSKKLIIFLYSVLFVVIILISVLFAFSINKIDTEFTFIDSDGKKAEAINEKLASYFGKNLLFLKTDEIADNICEDPYIDCISVEKSFPNTVKVVAKERREVYIFSYGDEDFIADENGFVLRRFYGDTTEGLISLCFNNFDIEKPVIGTYIKSDFDNSLKNAFDISKSVGFSDRFYKMTVSKEFNSANLTECQIYFSTYTNVTIKIYKSDDLGVEKAKAAFDAYDFKTTDYEKSFYSIEALKLDGGLICVTWTRNGKWVRDELV